MKTQIMFTPDTRALHELGANWENIVFDIHEFLLEKGFEYDRTLGYIREGETDEDEMRDICGEIIELGLGTDYFIALHASIIDNVTDLTYLFRDNDE